MCWACMGLLSSDYSATSASWMAGASGRIAKGSWVPTTCCIGKSLADVRAKSNGE